MNYITIASEILRYYTHTRQTGHTTAMAEGAGNIDRTLPQPMVVAYDSNHARNLDALVSLLDVTKITLPEIEAGCLRGSADRPLILDHYPLSQLIEGLFVALGSRDRRIANLESAMKSAASLLLNTATDSK